MIPFLMDSSSWVMGSISICKQSSIHLNNTILNKTVRNVEIIDLLFRFADMTEIFVCLQRAPLLVHPLTRGNTIIFL